MLLVSSLVLFYFSCHPSSESRRGLCIISFTRKVMVILLHYINKKAMDKLINSIEQYIHDLFAVRDRNFGCFSCLPTTTHIKKCLGPSRMV